MLSTRSPARNSTPQVEDIADLFVDDRLGQAEARDLSTDHPAGLRGRLSNIDDSRSPAAARSRATVSDAGPAPISAMRLPFCGFRRLGQARADVVLEVGRHALEAADRYRLRLLAVAFLDAPAPAGGLTGAIAGAAEDAGEDVRSPVDHVGVAVAALRDQPDVFGNGGMGRAGPLAIDDFVKVVGVADVCRVQNLILCSRLPVVLPGVFVVGAGGDVPEICPPWYSPAAGVKRAGGESGYRRGASSEGAGTVAASLRSGRVASDRVCLAGAGMPERLTLKSSIFHSPCSTR